MLDSSILASVPWKGPLAAFLLTFFGLLLLLRSGLAHKMAMDAPNHRSLHRVPTPRIGGVALVSSLLLTWMASGWDWHLTMLAMALAVLSYLDDRDGLPVALRLSGQLGVAVAAVWLELPALGFVAATVAVLAVVWGTNLYNFMDGADGLAGGMGFFGFLAYGIAAAVGGNTALATACVSVSAACLGFLLLNFPPARTFMGDAGSICLGFLAGALGLVGWRDGLWSLWFPLLVFSPFALDATVTLVRRAMRLEKVWVAHRDHYYQRLIRIGWSHRRLALHEYAVMATCAAFALILLRASATEQLLGFLAWAVLYASAMIKIDLWWKKYSATHG